MVSRIQMVLIDIPMRNTRDKSLPYPRSIPSHTQGMSFFVPAIKVPNYRHPLRIGGPEGERGSFHTLNREWMGSQFIEKMKMASLFKKINIMVGQEG